jgi:hypothetical protein
MAKKWYEKLGGILAPLPTLAYEESKKKPPDVPQYEPSELEKEYTQRLQDILSGKDTMYSPEDAERRYKIFKEQLEPTLASARAEYGKRAARLGISGGPQIEFEKDLGRNQSSALIQARQAIENEIRQLEEARRNAAIAGLGQAGYRQTSGEQQEALLQYQQDYQQYMQLQELLGNILGNVSQAGMMYATGGMPTPQYLPSQYSGGGSGYSFPVQWQPSYYPNPMIR